MNKDNNGNIDALWFPVCFDQSLFRLTGQTSQEHLVPSDLVAFHHSVRSGIWGFIGDIPAVDRNFHSAGEKIDSLHNLKRVEETREYSRGFSPEDVPRSV